MDRKPHRASRRYLPRLAQPAPARIAAADSASRFEVLLLRETCTRAPMSTRRRWRARRPTLRAARRARQSRARLAPGRGAHACVTSGAGGRHDRRARRRNPRQAGRRASTRGSMLRRLSGQTHQVLTAVAVAQRRPHGNRAVRLHGRIPRPRRRGNPRLRRQAASRSTRPARTRSRDGRRCSCARSPAAIPASWACRCSRPRSYCGVSASPI